ncbi:hypothetical protein PQX77_009189, partial [Marasmius sp. AFHP31]
MLIVVPDDTRSIFLDALEHAPFAPSLQAVVAERVQQAGSHPNPSETIPTSSLGHNEDLNPEPNCPLPLSFGLTSLPLVYTGDPGSPATFLGLQEDACRMPSPPTATINDTSVPAAFFQPPGIIAESLQVSQAPEGMVESIVGHPTFFQAPWSFTDY